MGMHQSIITKALKEHQKPFQKDDHAFAWEGTTRVKRKSTGQIHEVQVSLSLQGNKRVQDQLAACLCKDGGARFEDLRIAAMVDPKLSGRVQISSIPGIKQQSPGYMLDSDFMHFMRKCEKELENPEL